MSSPLLGDVHVNVPLSNMSLMFTQDETSFVATRVFPTIPVPKISDVYYTYTRADFNRNLMKKRAPGTESAGAGYTLNNTASYTCDVWSLHKDIADQVRANSDSVLAPDLEATKFLSQQALINKEQNWVNTYFATSIWNTQASGSSTGATGGGSISSGTSGSFMQWGNASSTPIEDVRKMKQLVQIQTAGYRPNKLVLGRQVFDVLLDHPDIIDRIKYSGGVGPSNPAITTRQVLAQLFEVEEVLVADGLVNSAPEGPSPDTQSTFESNAFIAGKHALLAYTPSAPGIMTAAAGYTFAWTGFLGATALGTRIKSFYLPWLESQRTEMDSSYTFGLVSADLGGFLASAVA